MIKEKFTFLSSNKKTNIYAIRCFPEKVKCTKVLQIIHGMSEYIEKYLPFIEFLTLNGFIVVGHDHLGHGASFTNSEDRGYFGEPEPDSLLIQDIHTLRLMTQEKYKDMPYFMLGHSMGSFLLRQYISSYSENLSGVILLGTGYASPCLTSILLQIIKLFACFKGWHHRSNFLQKWMHSNLAKNYDTTGKNYSNSWLTRDPEQAKILLSDDKSNFQFTLNGLYGLFTIFHNSCNPSNFIKIKKDLPILIASGQEDPLGNNGKDVEKCYQMMKLLGSTDVTMKLFEKDRHELLKEIDRKDVYEYIKVWIEKKSLLFHN